MKENKRVEIIFERGVGFGNSGVILFTPII